MAKTNTAPAPRPARTLPPTGSLFLAFRAAGFGTASLSDTAPAADEDCVYPDRCRCASCDDARLP